MTDEFSAGGLVFKKENGKTMWLICQHSHHKGWVFPKGLIGDEIENESKEDTAVREVEEETGITANIIKKLPTDIEYVYTFDDKKFHKTVYYFLMKHIGGNFDNRDHEMMDVRWADEEEVKRTLTYDNDKNAFDEALKLYNRLN